METGLGPPSGKRCKRDDTCVYTARPGDESPGHLVEPVPCPICLALVATSQVQAHVNSHLDEDEQATNRAVALSLQTVEDARAAKVLGSAQAGRDSIGNLDADTIGNLDADTAVREGPAGTPDDIICTVEHCRQVVPVAEWAAHAERHSRELAETLEAETKAHQRRVAPPAGTSCLCAC